MYKINYTTQFKKDYKTIIKRKYDISKLEYVIDLLINNVKLPTKYKDHILKNNYKNHNDCHILPDWILINFIDKKNKIISLVRTGTHSDLF